MHIYIYTHISYIHMHTYRHLPQRRNKYNYKIFYFQFLSKFQVILAQPGVSSAIRL